MKGRQPARVQSIQQQLLLLQKVRIAITTGQPPVMSEETMVYMQVSLPLLMTRLTILMYFMQPISVLPVVMFPVTPRLSGYGLSMSGTMRTEVWRTHWFNWLREVPVKEIITVREQLGTRLQIRLLHLVPPPIFGDYLGSLPILLLQISVWL